MEYSENQILTAGKLKSIQMLHEGAIRFIKEALEDNENRNKLTIKAKNIIVQLQMSLKPEESAESALLFHLYDYIFTLLNKGNDESLKNSIMLFEHLSNTFKMIKPKR